MKALILCAALAAAGPTLADDFIARARNGDTIRLTSAPCEPDILALIPLEYREMVKAAATVIEGKPYRACWINRGDGSIGLQYEDGDGAVIPISHFQRAPGA